MYFIHHPDGLLHDVGAWHPERPARLTRIRDYLLATGRLGLMTMVEAPMVTREQLMRVHAPAYLSRLERLAASAGPDTPSVIDSDTMLTPTTLLSAGRAAGAVVQAVDLVLDPAALATHRRAFCAGRPPGHHATRKAAMGFCFYNNVAIGAAHALATHHVRRVAIVDFDVHHGNGTEDIFADPATDHSASGGAPSGRVLLLSAFQYPFYPPLPDGPTAENVVHVRLPAGTGSTAFREAISAHLLPPLMAYRPDLLMLSAGFDGHAADPYADWQLHEDDFGWLTTALLNATDCPVVSVLEGGYDLPALGRCTAAHLDALL